MTKDTTSTRRSFLKSSAILAAPLAAAVPAAVIAEDGLKARLARLEDEAAIRELHQSWLRRVNTIDAAESEAGDATASLLANSQRTGSDQTVRSIAADHSGEPDAIKVAADGARATGRFYCAVEIGFTIPKDTTLAQMAHAQGGGFVQRTERRVLKVEYTKAGGGWAIASAELTPPVFATGT
jgi:lysozyme family protein